MKKQHILTSETLNKKQHEQVTDKNWLINQLMQLHLFVMTDRGLFCG